MDATGIRFLLSGGGRLKAEGACWLPGKVVPHREHLYTETPEGDLSSISSRCVDGTERCGAQEGMGGSVSVRTVGIRGIMGPVRGSCQQTVFFPEALASYIS